MSELTTWARSGAMHLTGRPDSTALGPPAPLVETLTSTARDIERATEVLGRRVVLDPLAILTERAAIAGLRRGGDRSCGGSSRLLRCADGWLAVTLNRDDDLELLPAWLGIRSCVDRETAFEAIRPALATRRSSDVVLLGGELGLAVAGVGEQPPRSVHDAIGAHRLGDAPTRRVEGARVIDLSSLWAGPLVGRSLVAAGADVVKVESAGRPEQLRHTDPRFFDLMHAGKRSVALDFRDPHGRRALQRLVASADVVIEASRPRALRALGIDAHAMTRSGPQVWLSITGHGRDRPLRIAFGDDAAAAGGAVVHDRGGPCFCADALADPVTGLIATRAVLGALERGGRWLLDASMASCAAAVAGPTETGTGAVPVPPPIPRVTSTARPFGADTASVVADLVC